MVKKLLPFVFTFLFLVAAPLNAQDNSTTTSATSSDASGTDDKIVRNYKSLLYTESIFSKWTLFGSPAPFNALGSITSNIYDNIREKMLLVVLKKDDSSGIAILDVIVLVSVMMLMVQGGITPDARLKDRVIDLAGSIIMTYMFIAYGHHLMNAIDYVSVTMSKNIFNESINPSEAMLNNTYVPQLITAKGTTGNPPLDFFNQAKEAYRIGVVKPIEVQDAAWRGVLDSFKKKVEEAGPIYEFADHVFGASRGNVAFSPTSQTITYDPDFVYLVSPGAFNIVATERLYQELKLRSLSQKLDLAALESDRATLNAIAKEVLYKPKETITDKFQKREWSGAGVLGFSSEGLNNQVRDEISQEVKNVISVPRNGLGARDLTFAPYMNFMASPTSWGVLIANSISIAGPFMAPNANVLVGPFEKVGAFRRERMPITTDGLRLIKTVYFNYIENTDFPLAALALAIKDNGGVASQAGIDAIEKLKFQVEPIKEYNKINQGSLTENALRAAWKTGSVQEVFTTMTKSLAFEFMQAIMFLISVIALSIPYGIKIIQLTVITLVVALSPVVAIMSLFPIFRESIKNLLVTYMTLSFTEIAFAVGNAMISKMNSAFGSYFLKPDSTITGIIITGVVLSILMIGISIMMVFAHAMGSWIFKGELGKLTGAVMAAGVLATAGVVTAGIGAIGAAKGMIAANAASAAGTATSTVGGAGGSVISSAAQGGAQAMQTAGRSAESMTRSIGRHIARTGLSEGRRVMGDHDAWLDVPRS